MPRGMFVMHLVCQQAVSYGQSGSMLDFLKSKEDKSLLSNLINLSFVCAHSGEDLGTVTHEHAPTSSAFTVLSGNCTRDGQSFLLSHSPCPISLGPFSIHCKSTGKCSLHQSYAFVLVWRLQLELLSVTSSWTYPSLAHLCRSLALGGIIYIQLANVTSFIGLAFLVSGQANLIFSKWSGYAISCHHNICV